MTTAPDDYVDTINIPLSLGIPGDFLGHEGDPDSTLKRFPRDAVLGELYSLVSGSQLGGGVVFTNKAQADAHLAYNAYQLALVVSDTTAANNGIYQKQGASGVGSWTKLSNLPFSFEKGTNTGLGTANNIAVSTTRPISSDTLVTFAVSVANTSDDVNVTFNGADSYLIRTNRGNVTPAGSLVPGMLLAGYIDGSIFRLINDSTIEAIADAALVTAEAATRAAADAALTTTTTGLRNDVGTNPNGLGIAPALFAQVRDMLANFQSGGGVKSLFNYDSPDAVWGSVIDDATSAVSTGSTIAGNTGKQTIAAGKVYTISMEGASGWTFGNVVHQFNAGGAVTSRRNSASSEALFSSDHITFLADATATSFAINLVNTAGDATLFAAAKARVAIVEGSRPLRNMSMGSATRAIQVRGVPQMLANHVRQARSRNLYDQNLPDASWSSKYDTTTHFADYVPGASRFAFSGLIAIDPTKSYTKTLVYGSDRVVMIPEIIYFNEARTFISSFTSAGGLSFSDNNQTVNFNGAGASFVAFNYQVDGTATISEAEFNGLRERIMVCEGSVRLPFEKFQTSDNVLPGPEFGGGIIAALDINHNLYIRDRWSLGVDRVQVFFIGSAGSYNVGTIHDLSGTAGPLGAALISAGCTPEDTIAAYNTSQEIITVANDDTPALFINATPFGGNHGPPSQLLLMNSHGKDNRDIGSKWLDGASKVWVISRVPDANHITVVEMPGGTPTKWTLTQTLTGTTLTHQSGGGATHTGNINFTVADANDMLRPYIQRQKVRVLLDGTREISAPGVYCCDRIDIAQSYGVPNTRSLVDALIARVGSTAEAIYNSTAYQTQIEINVTYSFRPGEMMVVGYETINVQDYSQDHEMGMMAEGLNVGSDKRYLFIPRSTAVGGVDYSTPRDITAGVNFLLTSSSWADPTDPPERFAEIRTTAGGVPIRGLLMGYSHLMGMGVPAVRAASILTAMRVIPDGKIYPWFVDTAIGVNGAVNDFWSVLGYRGHFDGADPDIASQGVYSWGGKKYWVFDTKATLTKAWKKPPFGAFPNMIGKKVSVIGNGKKSSSLTMHSEILSERGVLLTTTAGGGWFIAEVG